MILGFRNKVKIHFEGLHLIPSPLPPFTSCSFKLISSFLLGNSCDQNSGGCDYLCVNLNFSNKTVRDVCVTQKDMNLKGDAKTCEKTQYLNVSVLLGHLKNMSLSVACYDTLSFKMPFI